jgi:hypothetical protein
VNSFLAALYLSIRDLVEPLARKFASLEAFEYLCYRYGWEVSLDEGAFGRIDDALAFPEHLERFLTVAGTLQAQREAQPEADVDLQTLGELIDAADGLITSIATLTSPSLSGVPPPFDAPEFWASIGDHLFDDLLEEYLRLYRPPVFLALHAGGVLRYEPAAPDAPFRRPYDRILFDWEQLSALLRDPLPALQRNYQWTKDPEVPLEHRRLVAVLGAVAAAVHLPSRTFLPTARGRTPETTGVRLDPDADAFAVTFLDAFSPLHQAVLEFGLELFVATKADSPVAKGLVLQPVVRAGAAADIPLGDDLSLRWKAAASAGEVLGVAVFPDEISLVRGDASLGIGLEVVRTSTEPLLLFGSPGSARAELYGASAGLSIEGTVDDPEFQLRAGSAGLAGAPGLKVIIPLDDADGFVQTTVRTSALEFSFTPELIWSSKSGFHFNGKPTFDVNVPIGLAIGPVTLTDATVSIGPAPETAGGTGGWALRIGLSLTGRLGPVTFVIENAGVRLHVAPASRADVAALPAGTHAAPLGVLDLGLDFAPPKGLGVSVDAAGIVTGGGYLFFDPEAHTYGGVMQLSIHESIGVKAFGLVTTRLPDGRKGYSLVVFITVEDFSPIQLGFGFALVGIGGMLGVHRTFDEEVLRQGVQTGMLGTLLFPKDPIANAPAIIRALTTAFPLREGSYLFGILAKVAWFTPPLVLFELALILEMGARRRLLVLGRVRALLPSADNDLIRLNLDSMGVLDFDQGSASIDAVLVDSRLAHKFVLTGGMALRARWSSGPGSGFVLAVGGLNPRFAPPAALPPLARVAIALSSGENPRLTCEAYFAITSNTVQFGARAEVYAAAYGFSVEGDVGFDVLIEMRPFHFIADFHASVQLKRGSRPLFKVSLDGELEGPRPLRVSGKAAFEILCCDVSVRFDKTLIEGEKPPLPPAVDALAELRRALETPANWTTRHASNRAPGVTLTPSAPGAVMTVDPLGSLVVRQLVVPLNTTREIELFGGAPVAGERRFQITATLEGEGRGVSPVRDQFAPSQFFEMSTDEKLSGPSFEEMDAGVVFGGDDLRFDEGQIVAAPLVYKSVLIGEEAAPPPGEYLLPPARLEEQSRTGSVASAAIRTAGLARFRDAARAPAATLTPVRWTIRPVAGELDATLEPRPPATWSEARAAVDAMKGTGVRWQVVPVRETVG